MQAADIVNMLRREVEIHCRLKHKNIVRLYGYFHDNKNVYLILEYLSQGELFKRVAKSGGIVTETVCKQYMHDIASAVSYMHQRYVAHRGFNTYTNTNIYLNNINRFKA
jgi:serine/threonine protein kinase